MIWKSEIPSNSGITHTRTVEQLAEMLRRGCLWQQARGTKRDNGYPYHKHLPDCTICEAAEALESLHKELSAEIESRDRRITE